MKVVVFVGGVVVVGGLIVLAVAGMPGATAILVTVAALFAMVVLGGQMGGRHTPNVRPVSPGPRPVAGATGATAGDGHDAAAPPEPTTEG
jgi:hypothetical protein